MWQVRRGVASRKGFATRETSCPGARAKLQQAKRVGGGGLVAMASVTLTDNQLSHVWEQLRVPPAGCSYLQDIFQIIRKYAKIAAHAFWASAERPWGKRGRTVGFVLGSTRAILASCTNFAQRTTTRIDSTLHVPLRIVALARCIVLRCAFVLHRCSALAAVRYNVSNS